MGNAISSILAPGKKPAPERDSLRDFFPGAASDVLIARQPNLFIPDAWAKTFAHGLNELHQARPEFADSHVLEVGVGSGINMAGLLTLSRPVAGFTGVDISEHAVSAAGLLAEENGWDVSLLESDVLKHVPDRILGKVNHIIACIPQVPKPPDMDLSEGDNHAHFYEPRKNSWEIFGLGLNADLLDQASRRARHASITLNLAGRPGLNRLKTMFEFYGYAPEVTYSRMVNQHQGTTLAPLASLEKSGGHGFEFFADKHGQEAIPAVAAENRRQRGEPVYHHVHVITAPALN